MKIVVVIPARYGSTRFAGKPLALIKGKPMIQWVYEIAKNGKGVSDVVVATDNQRIVDAVDRFDGRAMMTGEENRSGTDRVADAAQKMGLLPDDIVVNIQGDQPAFVTAHIDAVVNPLVHSKEAEMTTLAFKIVDPQEITNPKDCKVIFDARGYALYFSRSPIPCARDIDTVFDTYKHLGIYAYSKRFLDTFRKLPTGSLETIEKLEQLRALENGHRIKVVLTEYDSPEVDVPADIPRIEALMKKRP
ncbi:MAG: 3-deoxy-manno-octulosonate cytidylyltransferase [Desulfobacterales bacterium]|nr:3-deoxy-manno-octulosonate cytidylyltransferase [Desulfobacterales bacterium]